MNNSKYIFLSYGLNPELSAYANGKRIEIDEVRKISCGDSSNNTELYLPTHFGTHIDFPFHFSNNGKKIDDYNADYFISKRIQLVDISNEIYINNVIDKNIFKNIHLRSENDLLLIHTGYCKFRAMNKYWEDNPAFHPELANFFKKKMPNLRMVGFDTISLSGWHNRELGREAHRKFLIDNEILILEDMDLSELNPGIKLKQVIISPLRVSGLEGAPVTVIAEVGRNL